MKMTKRYRDPCWSVGRHFMLPKDGTGLKEDWRCDRCGGLSVTFYLDDFQPYPADPLRALREILAETRVKYDPSIGQLTLERHLEYIAQIAELELSKHSEPFSWKSLWPFGRQT